jgi:hypothetical protein
MKLREIKLGETIVVAANGFKVGTAFNKLKKAGTDFSRGYKQIEKKYPDLKDSYNYPEKKHPAYKEFKELQGIEHKEILEIYTEFIPIIKEEIKEIIAEGDAKKAGDYHIQLRNFNSNLWNDKKNIPEVAKFEKDSKEIMDLDFKLIEVSEGKEQVDEFIKEHQDKELHGKIINVRADRFFSQNGIYNVLVQIHGEDLNLPISVDKGEYSFIQEGQNVKLKVEFHKTHMGYEHYNILNFKEFDIGLFVFIKSLKKA